MKAVKDPKVGTILSCNWVEPATDRPGDREAAQIYDDLMHGSFLEPLLRGSYPESVAHAFADHVQDGDPSRLKLSLDWLGVNYYTRTLVEGALGAKMLGARVKRPGKGTRVTDMGWEIFPDGLGFALRALQERLNGLLGDEANELPLYITELGAAFPDTVDDDGKIEDTERVRFLHQHLEAALESRSQGIDLRGASSFGPYSTTTNGAPRLHQALRPGPRRL